MTVVGAAGKPLPGKPVVGAAGKPLPAGTGKPPAGGSRKSPAGGTERPSAAGVPSGGSVWRAPVTAPRNCPASPGRSSGSRLVASATSASTAGGSPGTALDGGG